MLLFFLILGFFDTDFFFYYFSSDMAKLLFLFSQGAGVFQYKTFSLGAAIQAEGAERFLHSKTTLDCFVLVTVKVLSWKDYTLGRGR